MYAPVFFPHAEPVPTNVREAERAILMAEGAYHVDGTYYANASDAAQQRRWVAERTVREAERRDAWNAKQRAASVARIPAPRVSTFLTTRERAQLDAAVGDCTGCLVPAHRDALATVRTDVAAGQADAVLVSAARITAADVPTLAALVRAFPAVPVAGFVSAAESAAGADVVAGALLLGGAGVGTVLDCRTPRGWTVLRGTFAPCHLPDAFARGCVASVLADVRGERDGAEIADGLARFFVLAFAPDVTSAKQVAARLGVPPSTLGSRFFRAGLPSIKRYVSLARLTWAASLGEQPGLSLAAIASRLDASSPQSFHRTVRTLTGGSAAQFRRTTTGRTMLDHYRAALVTPYRDVLRTFDPIGADSRASRARPSRPAAGSLASGRAA